jgi:hypothetical protein
LVKMNELDMLTSSAVRWTIDYLGHTWNCIRCSLISRCNNITTCHINLHPQSLHQKDLKY